MTYKETYKKKYEKTLKELKEIMKKEIQQEKVEFRNSNQPDETSIVCNESEEGETIEMKIRRMTETKEPITDGAPIIYTERKDGVNPQTNIRADRFDLAVEAMDKVHKSKIASRKEALEALNKKETPTETKTETPTETPTKQ